MKILNVEIKGIGFPNKGAELMLAAILHEFEVRGVSAKFSVEPYGDYGLRARYGLFQKARVHKMGIDFGALISLLPKKLLDVFGIVRPRDIDVVLDASGFSYGDQWGANLIEYRLGTTISALKKRGVKVVLLPQAFGPFEDTSTKEVARNILSQADLVFARDIISLKHCRSIMSSALLDIRPDFTNLVAGLEWSGFDAAHHEICFIPNLKMIEKTTSGNEYISLMVKLIDFTKKQGKNPFLLIHEGEADKLLANEIASQVNFELQILEPLDPLKIKWVIGQSKVVVSSRFHGLVSALSQGVPVLATGWSHKYQCLLEDYNVNDALIDVVNGRVEAEKYLGLLLSDNQEYIRISNTIRQSGVRQKETVELMWDKVFSIIGADLSEPMDK
jgi:hypothetical protein